MSHFLHPRHPSYRDGVVLRSLGVSGWDLFMSFGRKNGFIPIILCIYLVSFVGCVTRTERISPYEQAPKDESVWEELRREFGGDDPRATSNEPTPEPFYTRAARSVKETVSGWFHEDATELSAQDIAADRRRFERKRAQALEQLRDQQGEAVGEGE
jgi:hypothetical protein